MNILRLAPSSLSSSSSRLTSRLPTLFPALRTLPRPAPHFRTQRTMSSTTPTHSAYEDFLKHNQAYVADHHHKNADLPIQPAKKLAVVACMDARINMLAHLGLKEGDAHIIRNAGGAAKDALRSLIISQQMLGTREIALFHHTGCGMASCTSHSVRQRVKDNLPADRKDVVQVDGIDFLEFSDLEGSVKEDVEWLKVHPLILPGTVVTGWVYEVESGAIRRLA